MRKITGRRSSEMAGRMEGALLVCGLLLLSAAGPQGAMGQASNVELLDVTNSTIKFEQTFDIVDAELGFSYPFGFFFASGWTGDAVRTDTQVTMGWEGNTSQIFACRGGKMILVDVSTSGPPQDALLRVRSVAGTSNVYQIEITESTNSHLQLAYCSKEGILCSEQPGTQMSFRLSSDFSLLRRPAYLAATAAA